MKQSTNMDERTNFSEILSYSLADNTRTAYDKGWKCFQSFCSRRNKQPLSVTPDDVTDFLIEIATCPRQVSGNILSMSTVSLYACAINSRYNQIGLLSPTQHPKVKCVLRGLVRIKGSTCRRVRALRDDQIRMILDQCDMLKRNPQKTLISLRDAAIISIGFAGALRRSEICNLTTHDIELINSASTIQTTQYKVARMYLHIRKSKTDQEGRGQRIPVVDGKNLNPIKRLLDWMEASKISEGYLFQTMGRGGVLRGKQMHHSDIPRLVKHYAARIGLDPSEYAGHSLRSGFVTSAAIHHARLDKIMEITRHTNPATVMKYIRDVDSFQNHAGENFL